MREMSLPWGLTCLHQHGGSSQRLMVENLRQRTVMTPGCESVRDLSAPAVPKRNSRVRRQSIPGRDWLGVGRSGPPWRESRACDKHREICQCAR